MRSVLSSLDPVAKAFESAGLCLRFIQSETYKSARAIFAFMPLKDEVDVLPILRAAIADGKKVLLPKILGGIKPNCKIEIPGSTEKNSAEKNGGGEMDFYCVEHDPIEETEANEFGMYEPKPSCKKIDIETFFAKTRDEEIVVLVPGLAFTKDGLRLGRGGGYYDRFLERFSKPRAANKGVTNSEQRPKLIGVCYEAQLLKELPYTHHDIQMDAVLCARSDFHL